MFGIKTVIGLQELEEQNTILRNFALMAMQCSPMFKKHVELTAADYPYIHASLVEEQLQVINEYKKLVEKFKDIEKAEDFFLIRTA